MNFLASLRSHAFWLIDFVKGGKVKAAYERVKRIDLSNSDDDAVIQHINSAWEDLRDHACTTTPFYASYAHRSIKEFPVITKQDIRNAEENFFSSAFKREDLITMSTSGSTGTPFVCYQNGLKKRSVNAEVIYYSEKLGYSLGENLSYIRTVVKKNKKSSFKQFVQNQTLINCKSLGDEEIKTMLAKLASFYRRAPITVLAYASTYTAIKDYLARSGITKIENANVRGFISGSDMLFDQTREAISSAFGNVPVVSRYSNEENGVLGQDEGINNVFVINEANYIIEILDEDGNVLPDGCRGRIVVTDLYNYAMPMIRYDTGDVGAITMVDIAGRKKRCISDFGGRRVDVIYDATGNPLSPHAITNAMWEFTDVTQFQLVQTDRSKYVLRLNADDSFSRVAELSAVIGAILGNGAELEIRRENEIPVLASGKRRYIVNEWLANDVRKQHTETEK